MTNLFLTLFNKSLSACLLILAVMLGPACFQKSTQSTVSDSVGVCRPAPCLAVSAGKPAQRDSVARNTFV